MIYTGEQRYWDATDAALTVADALLATDPDLACEAALAWRAYGLDVGRCHPQWDCQRPAAGK